MSEVSGAGESLSKLRSRMTAFIYTRSARKPATKTRPPPPLLCNTTRALQTTPKFIFDYSQLTLLYPVLPLPWRVYHHGQNQEHPVCLSLHLHLRTHVSLANSRRNRSGGGNKQDESTYDPNTSGQTTSNTGRLTGEGSHLSSATGNTGAYLLFHLQASSIKVLDTDSQN